MADTDQPLTIGIEEEYLLVDRETCDLVRAPKALMDACKADLQGKVSPEFRQCQIEVGIGVCQTIGEAHDDLRHLRGVSPPSNCASAMFRPCSKPP